MVRGHHVHPEDPGNKGQDGGQQPGPAENHGGSC
jgi:hypothetical protein